MQSKTVTIGAGITNIPLPSGKKLFGIRLTQGSINVRYFCGTNPTREIAQYSSIWSKAFECPWPIGEGDFLQVNTSATVTDVTIAYDE